MFLSIFAVERQRHGHHIQGNIRGIPLYRNINGGGNHAINSTVDSTLILRLQLVPKLL